jgi:hypothetical protein
MKTSAQIHRIAFGKRELEFLLTRSKRKRLRIVVEPNLTGRVTAPFRATDKAVQDKAAWIARSLEQMRDYHPLPAPRQYTSGESFTYLGRHYRLKVSQGAFGRLREGDLGIGLAAATEHHAEEVGLPPLSIRTDDPCPRSVVDLALRPRQGLHAAEWQPDAVREPPDIALDRIITAFEPLFGFQILEDPLSTQSIPKQLFDMFVVYGALTLSSDRAGGHNGTL